MHAVRLRVGSAAEWTIAVALLAATFAVVLMILGEFRALNTRPPAAPAPATTPAAVPAGGSMAISVPALRLADGVEIRVGDVYDRVAGALGQDAELGAPTVENGSLGPRTTHVYRRGATRFILVCEPFERRGPPRVTAIYIQ